MWKIIPILLGVVISYVVALIMNALGFTNADGSTILDFSGVAASSAVGLPPFQLCKFFYFTSYKSTTVHYPEI